MTCYGINSAGNRCGLPAGYGTENEQFCMYHDDQNVRSFTVDGDEVVAVSRNPIETLADLDSAHIEVPELGRLSVRTDVVYLVSDGYGEGGYGIGGYGA